MNLSWQTHCTAIDWHELAELYRLAPLGNKTAAGLKTAYTNSALVCFARADGQLVAAGRALADGVDCAYLCDIAVHPDWQGRGVGRALTRRLLTAAAGHRKIMLYAVPDKQDFYARFGFRPMLTAMALFDDPALAAERGYIRLES